MIIYHPAYDLNHCAYRFITLLSDIDGNNTEWDTLQLLDFYYVFPHFLAEMRLPKNPIATRNQLNKISGPYETLPNPKRLIFELSTLHKEAARALVAKGILDKDLFLKNIITLYTEKVPESLKLHMSKDEKRNTFWYHLLVKVLAKYPINGKNGLKDRTQLMEYRYDTN